MLSIKRFLCLLAGLCGVALAIYLSLRPSPRILEVAWLPHWLARWCDQHGMIRNFPAFFLLGVPLLAGLRTGFARKRAILIVGLLAAGLEFAQIFMPNRFASITDILCSWAGLGLAWGLVELANLSTAHCPLLTEPRSSRRKEAPSKAGRVTPCAPSATNI